MSNEERNRKTAYRFAAELIRVGCAGRHSNLSKEELEALFQVRDALERAGQVPPAEPAPKVEMDDIRSGK